VWVRLGWWGWVAGLSENNAETTSQLVQELELTDHCNCRFKAFLSMLIIA